MFTAAHLVDPCTFSPSNFIQPVVCLTMKLDHEEAEDIGELAGSNGNCTGCCRKVPEEQSGNARQPNQKSHNADDETNVESNLGLAHLLIVNVS